MKVKYLFALAGLVSLMFVGAGIAAPDYKSYDIDYLIRDCRIKGIDINNIYDTYLNYWISYFADLLQDQSTEINESLLIDIKALLKKELEVLNENTNHISHS